MSPLSPVAPGMIDQYGSLAMLANVVEGGTQFGLFTAFSQTTSIVPMPPVGEAQFSIIGAAVLQTITEELQLGPKPMVPPNVTLAPWVTVALLVAVHPLLSVTMTL